MTPNVILGPPASSPAVLEHRPQVLSWDAPGTWAQQRLIPYRAEIARDARVSSLPTTPCGSATSHRSTGLFQEVGDALRAPFEVRVFCDAAFYRAQASE